VTAKVERLDRAGAARRLGEFPALLDAALRAQANAWVPYSHFPVGAAVLATDGRIFAGCNVESASYGATICGERTAVVSAVAAGVRHVRAVVVVTPSSDPSTPCGICRQLLVEFGPRMAVFAASSASDEVLATTLDELLPLSFTATDLDEAAGR
jgi:cytidine deaminase